MPKSNVESPAWGTIGAKFMIMKVDGVILNVCFYAPLAKDVKENFYAEISRISDKHYGGMCRSITLFPPIQEMSDQLLIDVPDQESDGERMRRAFEDLLLFLQSNIIYVAMASIKSEKHELQDYVEKGYLRPDVKSEERETEEPNTYTYVLNHKNLNV